jgi:hypothetical protein
LLETKDLRNNSDSAFYTFPRPSQAFWFEVIATPGLFFLATKTGGGQRGPIFAIAPTGASAFLLLFLGRKLRRVRAQEMRAVYLNHTAFVLASYPAARPKATRPASW